MKKRSIALLLALLICITPVASLAEYVRTQYADGSLWLRKGPGTGYGTNGYVKNGQSITVLSKGSSWSKIRVDANKKTGYIMTKYIKSSSSSSSSSGANVSDGKYGLGRITTKYSSSTVNVRKGPGTNFKSIGAYKRGTKMKITGQTGSWYLVKLISGGKEGYISKSYVTQGVSGKTTGDVYFRKGPGTGYGYYKVLSSGSSVTILSVNNGWAKVKTSDHTGYVSIKYLSY